jgi:hypothetical protein
MRSMGAGLLVNRWIRQHCPDLQEAQEQAIASDITNNLGALKPSIRANYPGTVYEASISMNAASARFGGDLLGKPYLAVPYLSQGYGEKAHRFIALALGNGDPAKEPVNRQIIDSWAQELGSEAFREAVNGYDKDAYREAGGRVDVGFSDGLIEVNWEPQAGQVPARATITAHLEAGRYHEALPLLAEHRRRHDQRRRYPEAWHELQLGNPRQEGQRLLQCQRQGHDHRV